MTERERLERLVDDLGWLVSDAPVELGGQERDAVGFLRFTIEEHLER